MSTTRHDTTDGLPRVLSWVSRERHETSRPNGIWDLSAACRGQTSAPLTCTVTRCFTWWRTAVTSTCAQRSSSTQRQTTTAAAARRQHHLSMYSIATDARPSTSPRANLRPGITMSPETFFYFMTYYSVWSVRYAPFTR